MNPLYEFDDGDVVTLDWSLTSIKAPRQPFKNGHALGLMATKMATKERLWESTSTFLLGCPVMVSLRLSVDCVVPSSI